MINLLNKNFIENYGNEMILENLIRYFFVIDFESLTKLTVLGRLLGKG